MKKLILLFCCATFSLSAPAAKKLPDFDVIKKELESDTLLPSDEWKASNGSYSATVGSAQFKANDRAIVAVFKIAEKKDNSLETQFMDTTIGCLKISHSVMGKLTDKQDSELLAAMSAAGHANGMQVSIPMNNYWFFSSLQPKKSEIVFTCGVRQNDF